ncbi:MAG: hypothetical protein QE271_02405 [Bacteriovoracaceae bacterium]|nr:hypothetical protein [Bacteriovoracaceae bacterium]
MKKILLVSLMALASASVLADYTCSVTALKQGMINGSPAPGFYPMNVQAAGSRIRTEVDGYISSGNLYGDQLVVESKKSYISFGDMMNGWDNQQEAKFIFARRSAPNRHGVMTKTDELGQVNLKGNDMKQIELDGGLYRMIVICNTNKL